MAESRRKCYGELRQSGDSENKNPQRPWRLCDRSVTSRVFSVVELSLKRSFAPWSTDMVYTLMSKLLKTIPQVFFYIRFVMHPECSLLFFFVWIGCRQRRPHATSRRILGWLTFRGSTSLTAMKLHLRVSHATPLKPPDCGLLLRSWHPTVARLASLMILSSRHYVIDFYMCT